MRSTVATEVPPNFITKRGMGGALKRTTPRRFAPPETGMPTRASPSVDPDEVARFGRMAARWWDANGPMRALHKLNPVRLAYLRDAACRSFGRDARAPFPLSGLTVLDVGCGGGILSEPLARLGATVTGLDPTAGNIAVAKRHAQEAGVAIDYRGETVEQVAAR